MKMVYSHIDNNIYNSLSIRLLGDDQCKFCGCHVVWSGDAVQELLLALCCELDPEKLGWHFHSIPALAPCPMNMGGGCAFERKFRIFPPTAANNIESTFVKCNLEFTRGPERAIISIFREHFGFHISESIIARIVMARKQTIALENDDVATRL